MKLWLYLVYFLFPIPLVFLMLLSLPLPTAVTKFIINILDRIIFLKLNSFISLYHFVTGLSVLLFFQLLSDSTKYSNSSDMKQHSTNAAGLSELKCMRWRAERNFWISAFSMTLWLILYKFRNLMKQVKSD